MSDTGTSASGNDLVLYSCRHCPGLVLTEAEKDVHREQHRRRRNISGLRHSREGSPATSLSAASFVVVQQPDLPGLVSKGNKQKKDDQAKDKAGKKKRRARKNFNLNVKKTRQNSG